MYRQKSSFEDIIKALIEPPYNVSRFTAQNDLSTAMEVFGAARKINKKYVLALKFERQEKDIERYRQLIFNQKAVHPITGDLYDVPPDSKDIMALAKLEEASTYTLNSMPKDEDKLPFVPTKVTLHLVKEDEIPMELPLVDALKMADAYIKSLPELIPEPVSNGSTGNK